MNNSDNPSAWTWDAPWYVRQDGWTLTTGYDLDTESRDANGPNGEIVHVGGETLEEAAAELDGQVPVGPASMVSSR